MDKQSVKEKKRKQSRSTARHLRRKKLTAARQETEHNKSNFNNDNDKLAASFKQEILANNNDIKQKTYKIDTEETSYLNLLKETQYIGIDNLSIAISYVDFKSDESGLINDCKLKIPTEICIPTSSSSKESINYFSNNITEQDLNILSLKMDPQEKSREKVKAEREFKKAVKAAAKAKAKLKDKPEDVTVQSISLKNVDAEDKNETVTINSESIHGDLNIAQTTKNTVIKNLKKTSNKFEFENTKNIDKTNKTSEKSKAELRAERRVKQEAQRAAKQVSLVEKNKEIKVIDNKLQKTTYTSIVKCQTIKRPVIKSEMKDNAHEVNLFKHLYLNRKRISEIINQNSVILHPAILRLGVQYAEKTIVGSNARCVALLAAVKQLIQDFERPSQADFTRGLETSLQESVYYLNFCRPSAVSMQNALKHLKWQMSTLPSIIPDDEAKLILLTAIDTYIQEQILLADKAISNAIQQKISNGDIILTYGFSSLINKILCDAYNTGRKFRVIITDTSPWLEGKELLRRLIKHGIDCSYMVTNALSFIMPQVSKVFLGAHAILANGAVMSRVGTAQIALMANAFNVPVLVACETHKSCERVQTDSIVYNEIGDPDLLVKGTFVPIRKSYLSNWKSKKTLNLLNITYDVTPADLVTAVVTELAILPCTSVPVILRIKPSEI